MPPSRVCVYLLIDSVTLPTFHHIDTRHIRLQHVMITTVIQPAAVQLSALSPPIHVSRSIPEGTTISLAAACRTNVIAARARDAREMYSVSTVTFGAEFGRLPTCFMPKQVARHH